MRHSGQVVVLVESRSVFVDLLKVVPAVAEVEQVPCAVIAPILRVLTAKLSKGARGALRWEKLAHSARCKRNLSAAKTNVEVDIVLEYKGSLKTRVKEPGDNISINYFYTQCWLQQGYVVAYHCRTLR